MKFIKRLDQFDREDLPLAGGKGANLGAMINAGMPVPPGFCVTTDAYIHFVSKNSLQEQIMERIGKLHSNKTEELEPVSVEIRHLFETASISPEISAEIRQAYQELITVNDTDPAFPVAVRSSATAEDLPDLSFAGQQDTYLNIVGEQELVQAVIRCWASLWTARAIGYRSRNGISQEEVSLAVVVQCMVQSEVSGVLFTANPLTGKRSETVIDATLGLGEALVSGMVEPDHYVVEDGKITSKTLGAKSLSIRSLACGGTETISEASSDKQALPDERILELARIGEAAVAFFGSPQDMEWGWAEGKIYILQSRAITTLFPLPEGVQTDPLQVYFSVASWQGMVDPFSPGGRDIMLSLIFGIGRAFGINTSLHKQTILQTAHGRLFLNITSLIRSQIGRTIIGFAMDAIDPVTANILKELFEKPEFAIQQKAISLKTKLNLVHVLLPTARGMLIDWLTPAKGRELLNRQIERLLADVRGGRLEWEEGTRGKDQSVYLPALVEYIEEKPRTAPRYLLPYLLPAVGSGQAPMQILMRSVDHIPNGYNLVLELTRGLPYNVTTEMDLRLWRASRAICNDPASLECFNNHEAEGLAGQYKAGELPAVAQKELANFLNRYGMRGLAEIDQYRERWSDNPAHIIQVIKGYLQLENETLSPERMFTSGVQKAKEAEETLVHAFRKGPFSWFHAWRVRLMVNRIRELGGLRESPKFTFIRIMGEMRLALRVAGERLVVDGVLLEKDDIFFLHLDEIRTLGQGDLPDVKALIAGRKADYLRQMSVRRIPRVLLSDGTTYYDFAGRVEDGEGVLTGSPVSAGVVEGRVHVVLNPNGTHLTPGEILVCPATDPAWTPLFLTAGGLITEIGGMITHGSVVAREYGIPAVVGINQATTLLKDGQRIRLDGNTGVVVMLEDVNVVAA